MAKKKINGITIALNADTKNVTQGLKDIVQQSVKTSDELKDVERLLKLNPNNVELLAQKQALLSDQISITSTKLEALKGAQEDVEKSFKNGDIGVEEYRAFQREIQATEGSLKGFKGQLANMDDEQKRLAQNTERLETLFQATGSEIDDYSDILGTRLTNAIKGGTASSDQLVQALNKVGRSALGADADLDQMKQALDRVDSSSGLNDIKQDLSNLQSEAGKTDQALGDMGDAISEGNLIDAGEVISEIGDKIIELGENAKDVALEFGAAQGTIQANTNLSATEMENLKKVANDVFATGVTEDINEAMDATTNMKTTFKDLNDTDLTKLTSQVISLSDRTGTDFQENIRGSSQLMGAFDISAQKAFDMIAAGYKNGLNVSGDFMDTLTEYAPLFEEAGFSADEMLQIMKNGMDNGAMNTDKVSDAVKELQIRLGDGTFEANLDSFSESTKNSFSKWKDGKATVADVAASIQKDLSKMSPQEQQEALSSISTQFEDLGIKAATSLFDVGESFTDVTGKMNEAAETDPAQEWQASLNEFMISLQTIGADLLTVLQPIIDVIAMLSGGIGSLPEPLRLLIVGIGGVIAIIAILLPLFASLAVVTGASGIAIGGLSIGLLPLIGIIAAVVAAIIGIIAVIKNWGAITDWFSDRWDDLSSWWTGFWDQFSSPLDAALSFAKGLVDTALGGIFGLFDDKLKGIQALFKGLKLAFPNIKLPKLPKFDIKWKESSVLGQKMSLPNIDVKWFKDGGLLTKPTIFGQSGSKLLGGGEAGKEAIAPLDKLMGYIQQAVRSEMANKTSGDEIHLHLSAYGNLPKEMLDQIAEYLLYKFTDLKDRNPFGGHA